MIGGGGKIGEGGGPPKVPDNTAKEPATQSPPQRGGSAQPSDLFEAKGMMPATAHRAGSAPNIAGEAEVNTAAEMLLLAKQNPAAAKRLVANLTAQNNTAMGELEKAMLAARSILSELGAERFSRKKRQEKQRELRKARDSIAALKRRINMGNRRISLLQQLAGELGNPRLDQELERLLSHHRELETDWGRSHHIISMGELLYGATPETPEHLQEVVRANMGGPSSDSIAAAMHEASPRRAIAELMARGLDGTTVGTSGPNPLPVGQELPKTLDTYGHVTAVINDAAARGLLGPEDSDGD